VQLRNRTANDSDYPTDGLLIWHVDARQGPDGGLLYDNSYTEHKLLRLMEADGLEEIERNLPADAGDFYTPGDVFGSDTVPSSHRYDGAPTNLLVDSIQVNGNRMGFRASLGSGCALFCDAAVGRTAWPRAATTFAGRLAQENCDATPSVGWRIGDVDYLGEADVELALPAGTVEWRFFGELGDAECDRHGVLLVCADERCRQWAAGPPMSVPRVLHAAVRLGDGRVLVAGGGPPEIYDPVSGSWTPTGPLDLAPEMARAVVLDDGRVLLVGSASPDPINAAIYDPASNSWRTTASMLYDRIYHAAVKLGDGRVLVAGGFLFDDGGAMEPVLPTEVFDPASESWTVVGDVPEPASDGWSPPRTLAFPRVYHVALPLADGRVLLVGGADTAHVTTFDPATNQERLVVTMDSLRILPAVAALPSGTFLVAGGIDASFHASATASVLDPAARTWSEVAAMADGRFGHALTLLPDGDVLATGGAKVSETGDYLALDTVESFHRPATPPLRVGARLAP
jgi:hypothetical protein